MAEVEGNDRQKVSKLQFKRQKKRKRRLQSPDEADIRKRYELDDEARFQESLFDAMAADEGADFYAAQFNGHSYETNRAALPNKDDTTRGGGVFDSFPNSLNDEDYAQYIRRGMSQHSSRRQPTQPKSSPYFEAAQQKKEEEERYRKEEARQKRAAEQKQKQRYTAAWERYITAWNTKSPDTWTYDTVPWPVYSGKPADVSKQAIQEFLAHRPKNTSASANPTLTDTAKYERNRRWHPDKFTQLALARIAPHDTQRTLLLVTQIAQSLNELSVCP